VCLVCRLQPSTASWNYPGDMAPAADAPVRVLSLESWGHRQHETGGVSKVKNVWFFVEGGVV